MKSFIIGIASILLTTTVYSQQDSIPANTLDYQFKTLYRKSSSYQEYKVIKKTSYNQLHKNVLDSIKGLTGIINNNSRLISSQEDTISNLHKTKAATTNKLQVALQKENSISLFGIVLTKSVYATILFSIIFILIVLLLYFIYKFKNSNVLTVAAKSDLQIVEDDFNLFRKKSLEREQKLRRQLQDEIIKNRGN
ncbi:MAG: hypothetical protein HWD85_10095 [Flavobacteriaceae bacterium]|nr:hypothetical protein [Flavobacteriaceae bacterium]